MKLTFEQLDFMWEDSDSQEIIEIEQCTMHEECIIYNGSHLDRNGELNTWVKNQ